MSEDRAEPRRMPFIFTVLLYTLIPILAIAIFSPNYVKESMGIELANMVEVHGEDNTYAIYENSLIVVQSVFYESGVMPELRNALLPREYLETGRVTDGEQLGSTLWLKVDDILTNIVLNGQYMIIRLYSMVPWVAIFFIVVTASVLSGYLMREIKKHGFEYSSPLRHGLSKRLIYWFPFIWYIFLVLPVVMPVYVVPITICIFAFTISLLVSNTIKRV